MRLKINLKYRMKLGKLLRIVRRIMKHLEVAKMRVKPLKVAKRKAMKAKIINRAKNKAILSMIVADICKLKRKMERRRVIRTLPRGLI